MKLFTGALKMAALGLSLVARNVSVLRSVRVDGSAVPSDGVPCRLWTL